jgi:hypothetical protein
MNMKACMCAFNYVGLFIYSHIYVLSRSRYCEYRDVGFGIVTRFIGHLHL